MVSLILDPFYFIEGRNMLPGKGGGSAPKAPDPAQTAKAQTQTNKDTAYWNAVLNNVNQITPYGNLSYTQTGGGKTYNQAAYDKALAAWNAQPATTTTGSGNRILNGRFIPGTGSATTTTSRGAMPKLSDFQTGDAPPSFTSEIKLSPEQQQLYDTQSRSQNALASLGEGQIGRIGQSVSTPFSFSGVPDAFSAEDAAMASRRGEEALMARLNPQFAQDEEALRTRLINQGIGQNSEAYNREMTRFGQMQNDARQQAILQGANYGGTLQSQALQRRNQGINEYTTQRNAPLNEYIGLTSGTQVQNPQFQNTNYGGAQPVDYAGLVNQNYQNKMGQYNANQASSNSLGSSLFGLAGTIGGSFLGSPTGGAMVGKWLGGLGG